jgi:hypothetical protein
MSLRDRIHVWVCRKFLMIVMIPFAIRASWIEGIPLSKSIARHYKDVMRFDEEIRRAAK